MPDTLAQRVRAKYPGAYDDLSDQQLETSVKAKFPGIYDDVPTTPVQTTAQQPEGRPSGLATIGEMVGDVAVGVGKGALNTIGGLGKMARKIPGVAALDRLVEPVDINITPTNTAQKIGFGAEQIGEFFIPVAGLAGKAAKVAEIGKSGVLTLAQTGSPIAAGMSAGITAAIPGAGAAQRASQSLRDGAQKSVVQALGPTKEWAKVEAKKLAPQMLSRGIGGSRAAMLEQASAQTASVGARIGAEIQAAAQAGQVINGASVRAALQHAAGGLHVQNAAGQAIPIAGTEAVVKRLVKLDDFVARLGQDIPIDKAAKIKTTFDQIVSKAGLYGQKVGASATDSADAWATREAAGGFRAVLANANHTLDDLNKEFAFWKGLKSVLTETEKRTQAQSGGLTAAITGAAGMGAGIASGDGVSDRVQNAVIGGLAGRQLVKAMQSPWWRTQASAPLKNALADALASGKAGQAEMVTTKMLRALPARLAAAQ